MDPQFEALLRAANENPQPMVSAADLGDPAAPDAMIATQPPIPVWGQAPDGTFHADGLEGALQAATAPAPRPRHHGAPSLPYVPQVAHFDAPDPATQGWETAPQYIAPPLPDAGHPASPLPGGGGTGPGMVVRPSSADTLGNIAAERRQLGEDEAKAARAVGDAEVDIAKTKADNAAIEQEARTAGQVQYDAVAEEANRRLQLAMDASQAAIDRHRQSGMRTFWGSKTAGDKLAGSIFVGMGEFAATLTGRNNAALAVLDREAERFHQNEVDRIKKLSDDVVMAGTGVKDATLARQTMLADAQAQKVALLEEAEAKMVARLTQKGVPLAQAQADARVVAVRKKALDEERQAYAESIRLHALEEAAKARTIAAQAKLKKGKGGGGGAGGAIKPGTVFGVNGEPLAVIPNDAKNKTAPEINKGIETYRDMRALAEKMLDSMARHGVAVPGTDAYQERESDATTLKLMAKELYNLGALSGPDMGLVEGIAGGLFSTATGSSAPKLRQLLKQMDSSMARKLDRVGLPGAKLAPRLRESRPAPAAAAPAGGGDVDSFIKEKLGGGAPAAPAPSAAADVDEAW